MHPLTLTVNRKRILLTAIAVLLLLSFPPGNDCAAAPSPTYIGSLACQPCHADEYQRFVTYAKKSRSFESIERLRKGLTTKEIEHCYSTALAAATPKPATRPPSKASSAKKTASFATPRNGCKRSGSNL